METPGLNNLEENKKKVFKAGIVDISKIAEAQARDIADNRMTETKEDRSKNWLVRTGKRIWKHNLAQEWYRQREIEKARKEISESDNLYVGESNDTNIKDYEKAKLAIVERFTSEYEEEMLKQEEKDSKKSVTDEKAKLAIKNLIKEFAKDPTMSEAAFKEEQKRILHESNPEYVEKGKMYADNLLDIAREIKNSISHGEKLSELDFDVEITLGQARESLNTEAKHNSFEKIVEKTQNSKLGKYLFNEPAAVLIAAGLYSAGNFLGMKMLRSKIVQLGTFGATALLAGGVSSAKEAARLNRERSQHMRESAKGMEFKEDDMKRRQEMEKNRYETKNASEIIQNLEKDLEKISTGNIKEEELDRVLVNLSDIEARIKLGDKEKIDLVAYSKFDQVEQERMNIDSYRAKVKVAVHKGIEEGRIEFTKGNFDSYLQKITNFQSEDLGEDVEEKNKIFKIMKMKKVASAFIKTALIGAGVGFMFQEIQTAFQSGNGHEIILDNAHTGEKVTEHITTNPNDYINKHPELMTKVNREWMDNDTKAFDKNEIKLEWGGVKGTGIDENGNYVFQVQHMTNDGSFHEGLSVAAQDQMKNGGLEVLLSVTKGTQQMVIPVHVDEFGKAIVDQTSDNGKMLFENVNGHAVFEGAYAEVGHPTGLVENGAKNMQILATHIGTDHANEITETIVHDNSVGPYIPTNEIPPFIPIPLARRPLEKGKYTEKIKTPEFVYYMSNYGEEASKEQQILFETIRSKTLKENPNAKLDHYKETKDYLEKQNPEYLEKIKKLADQTDKMEKNCKVSICIPIAGHQEDKNIYESLQNYTYQTAKPEEFELSLFVNHPEKDQEENLLNADKTLKEIERFKKDYPNINIRIMYEALPNKEANIGRIRKLLNDATLMRHHERGLDAPDLIMISNDADNKGIDPKYIQTFINKFEKNQKVDGYLGQLDWDPESYQKFPAIHMGTRLFQFLNTIGRYRTNRMVSSGANSAFRSSIYAGIGGYIDNIQGGEDIAIRQAIMAARKGNDNCWDFGGAKTRLFTSSRRSIDALKSGLAPIEQWSKGFSVFDNEIRKLTMKNETKINYDDKETQEKLKKSIEYIINRTLDTYEAGEKIGKNNPFYKKALGLLGIKYTLDKKGNIIMSNVTSLIKGLKKYQIEGKLMRDARSGKIEAMKELESIKPQKEIKEEKKEENSGKLEKAIENFIDELPNNTQKIDSLTKILSKSLDDKSLKNLGLDITINEIKKQLEDCKKIESGAEFIEKVKNIFKTISIAMDEHPEEFNRLQRKIFVEYHNFTPLNEIFSYRIDDGDLHLHLAPASDLNTGKKIQAIKDALEKLIKIISSDKKIKEISATSPIVTSNPGILKRMGFKIEGPISKERQKKDFGNETDTASRAVISRKEFLSKYSNKNTFTKFIKFWMGKLKNKKS